MNDKRTFKVIIAGSRRFNDYPLLCEKCDILLSQKHQTHDIVVISGTARGADTLGEQYAYERGYSVERFPADWRNLGKQAGIVRNRQMAEVADALIAFWDGKSHGTEHMITHAKSHDLLVRVINCNM